MPRQPTSESSSSVQSSVAVTSGDVGAHDLRRTCARLCHASGGELEQIRFLLGHVSVQTTERYVGCKQQIRSAVNIALASSLIPELGGGYGRVSTELPTNRE